MAQNILDCNNLHVSFRLQEGVFEAVRGLSFSLQEHKTLGIVGESGCGKSMTALALMRLIPNPPGEITAGSITFNNTELLSLPAQKMRSIRGRQMAMIFQDPMTSLNPLYTCNHQLKEPLLEHKVAGAAEADQLIELVLAEVGIPNPKRTAASYPHQLSGGMRQRVMIAMALICHPKLLIADEPTTALDVTVQAKILDLLHHLQDQKQMSMILITHNLGIVGDIADTVLVMYGGEIMELAPVDKLFDLALHPYTSSLLKTVPHIDGRKDRLTVIPGEVPTLANIPAGCPFHPRCSRAFARCHTEHPKLYALANDHLVRCFLHEKL